MTGLDGDDFGALEELEPLETLEQDVGTELPAAAPQGAGLPVSSSCTAQDLVASYSIVPIPIAILDESLGFMFRNEPFVKLAHSFGVASQPSLMGAIGRFLDTGTARGLLLALKDPDRGFSWTGEIRFKSKTTSSVLAKTTIMPFRPGSGDGQRPQAWVAFLDDVTEEREGFLRGLFSSLLEASKLKDNDTGKHIERVNLYAERLAKVMYDRETWAEVDIDFVDTIGFLAAMHDVGKIGTPDDILNKKGPLDEFEWGIMKEHTINGAFILSSYPNPMAKEIAMSHHEWWNGTGYPYNLVGKMIPLPARIVAMADVYDALRMKRSYKAPFDHARASQLIIADGGTHFDPALVEVFKGVMDDFEKIYDTNADDPES